MPLEQSDVMCSASSREPPKLALLVSVNPYTREAHITSKGNITQVVHITFRESGTHRSKTKSTSYEVLLFLARVDKKDANEMFGNQQDLKLYIGFIIS